MERIQLPWMSERYLFLLSYLPHNICESRVFRFSTIQINQHGSSFFLSRFLHQTFINRRGSTSCTSFPPVPWGTRLSAYVPIRIPTQELWPLFGVVEQNVLVPALRDEPKLKVTAVASMFRRSPPSAWRVWAEARSAVVRLSSREAIGAHEDMVNLQDDRVLQLK